MIERLVSGQPLGPGAVALLSDMDRQAVTAFREAWPGIPLDTRREIITEAALLEGQTIELDFERAFCVALDDSDAETRRNAAAGLLNSTNGEVGRKLMQLLDADRDAGVRRAAADGLRPFVLEREFGNVEEANGDAMMRVLRHRVADAGEDPEVRGRALATLGTCSEPWVRPLIEEFYYHDDRVLRLAAVEAMGQSAQEEWLDFLFEQLESEDPDFRYEAAVACGEIGSEEAIEPLSMLFEDEEEGVAVAAVEAVGNIGGPAALKCLGALAARAPEGLSDAIAIAMEVAGIVGGSSGEEEDL